MNAEVRRRIEKKVKRTMDTYNIPPSHFKRLMSEIEYDYGMSERARHDRIDPNPSNFSRITRNDILEIRDASKTRQEEIAENAYAQRRMSKKESDYAMKNRKWVF